jgi:hypothetical protein
LDTHLDSSEIEELLRFGSDQKEGSPNDQIDEHVRIHLEDCEICQTRLRAEGEAMERLARLGLETAEAPSPQCPPDNSWLELATGGNPNSEKLLSHAVQCDHCGPLLRQAKEDFSDELTPEEETKIAELSSSSTGWQKTLALKLHNSQSLTPGASPPRYRSASFLANLLAPSRLAFAGAIIGLIVLGIRDYRRTVYLLTQNLQATAEINHLEQSVLQQSRLIAELTAESRGSSTPAAALEPQPTGNVQIASMVMDPGLTRGIGRLKRLTIPRGTEIAKITLHLAETPDGVVREDLVTADGQKRWSQELRPPESEKRTNSLSLLIPVYLLTPDDYQIVLSHQSPAGFERLATYTFRVIR